MTATDNIRYSQNREQDYILEACADIRAGRFLDIGACHPTDKSNTRALYDLGWSGVMIEPGPKQMKSLLIEYGNDERIDLVCAALGPVLGLASIHATDDLTSTTDEATFEKWRGVCHYYGKFWTPTITVADVLLQFGCFDFVSIDTEGTSVQALRQLFDTGMLPRCICVEHDGRFEEAHAMFEAKHYGLVHRNGENLIYSRPAVV